MSGNLQQAAGFVAEWLLNGIPAGIVIALAAWIVLRLVGRKNSSTRFAVWFSSLVAIGVAPLIGGLSFGVERLGRTAEFTLPSVWGEGLLALWGLIAGMGLLRVGVGLWALGRLRKRHQAFDLGSLDPVVQQTVREFKPSRKVTLAISDEVRVPTAIGFFRPMIILPKWVLTELPAEELSPILIHELAHLKRWDDCTNLAQKILRAIFFFNPAICWIDNRLSLEREMACDDVVLARTDDPIVYARSLVAVAERSFVRRGIALAQAAVSRMRNTSHRVAQILKTDRSGATRVWKPAFAMVIMFSAASIGTLMRVPELISFQPTTEHVAPTFSNVAPIAPAMIVPASFHPTAAPTLAPRAQSTERPKSRHTVQRKPISRKPTLVLASAPSQDDVTMQTVFVVWHDNRQFTICVWRVTFVNSEHVAAGVPARST